MRDTEKEKNVSFAQLNTRYFLLPPTTLNTGKDVKQGKLSSKQHGMRFSNRLKRRRVLGELIYHLWQSTDRPVRTVYARKQANNVREVMIRYICVRTLRIPVLLIVYHWSSRLQFKCNEWLRSARFLVLFNLMMLSLLNELVRATFLKYLTLQPSVRYLIWFGHSKTRQNKICMA